MLAWAAGIVLLLPNVTSSNEIYINQAGDDLILEVQQRSKDNYASINATGDNNNITVYQGMHDDGTIDSDETGGHEAYWVISGANNTLEGYQTDTNRSGGGGDSHHYANYITGDGNSVNHIQMGKAGHDGFIEIQGDNNDVTLYQRGNGGQQWADIVLTGDDHTVDASQRGTMAHSFEVDLTNGGGAYSVTSNQTTNNTTTSKSYSLTGICTNSNGCSVSVSQN